MMPTTGNDVAPSPPPATPTTTSMTNTGTIQATNTDSAEPREGLHAVDPAVLSADGNGITWVSPSGNIWCRISEGEYGSGCQARDAPVPNGATCVNPTFTVEQLSKGFYLHPDSVQPACFNQGVFTTEHPTALEYGQSVTTGGYTCISRRSGMACTTQAAITASNYPLKQHPGSDLHRYRERPLSSGRSALTGLPNAVQENLVGLTAGTRCGHVLAFPVCRSSANSG